MFGVSVCAATQVEIAHKATVYNHILDEAVQTTGTTMEQQNIQKSRYRCANMIWHFEMYMTDFFEYYKVSNTIKAIVQVHIL